MWIHQDCRHGYSCLDGFRSVVSFRLREIPRSFFSVGIEKEKDTPLLFEVVDMKNLEDIFKNLATLTR